MTVLRRGRARAVVKLLIPSSRSSAAVRSMTGWDSHWSLPFRALRRSIQEFQSGQRDVMSGKCPRPVHSRAIAMVSVMPWNQTAGARC